MSEPKPGGIVNHPWLVLFGLLTTCGTVIAVFEPPRYCTLGQSSCPKPTADICVIRDALDSYAMSNGGHYPESLAVLVTRDERGHRYLNQDRIPRDPWNREYIYVRDPVNVATLGADGVPGGTGDDADIDAVSVATGR